MSRRVPVSVSICVATSSNTGLRLTTHSAHSDSRAPRTNGNELSRPNRAKHRTRSGTRPSRHGYEPVLATVDARRRRRLRLLYSSSLSSACSSPGRREPPAGAPRSAALTTHAQGSVLPAQPDARTAPWLVDHCSLHPQKVFPEAWHPGGDKFTVWIQPCVNAIHAAGDRARRAGARRSGRVGGAGVPVSDGTRPINELSRSGIENGIRSDG